MDEPHSQLLGTWALRHWYNEDEHGTRSYPLGKDATGYISYSPDGYVFVHLMAANRAEYAIADPFGGSAEEDSRAVKSQITYAGTYVIDDGVVTHKVSHSSFPNWVGTEQVRKVHFDGPYLELTATALMQGKTITAHVHWERAAKR